jgi:hypothetical protein
MTESYVIKSLERLSFGHSPSRPPQFPNVDDDNNNSRCSDYVIINKAHSAINLSVRQLI